tara:strand:- start:449 stop:844 length:396 start_codon:yes stop_codon:yes gene_type:complete
MIPSQQEFTIEEIEINGNRRSSFLIERKIKRYSQEDSQNKLAISINLNTNKNIHEKNIQNKVTKYKLSLTAETNIKNLKTLEIIKRSYSSNTTYNVEEKYNETLNNEKDARSRLIDEVVNQLLDELRINYN